MTRIILACCLVVFATIVFAASAVRINAMLIQPNFDETTITFVLSQKTTGKVKYMPDKKSVIVEFNHVRKNFNMQNAKLGDALVESITTKNIGEDKIQFIFSVREKIRWVIKYIESESVNEARLQLIITADKPAPKTSLTDDIDKTLADLSAQHGLIGRARLERIPLKPAIFTVVIDAGHGGHDVGAQGSEGVNEKDIVLAIAKKLAQEINQQPNMRAVLTRKGDYFVPLRARLKLARKGEADLFIAIHADAHYDAKARGASVYALSQRGATSEAARWLAKKDNYSELGDVELNALQDRSPILRSVLIDLAQTATIEDSLQLGNNVLDQLDNIAKLHYKHVEQAPFVVLKSPDIPSILVETGFISNPQEAEQLADGKYQTELAHALFLGINQYAKKSALQNRF